MNPLPAGCSTGQIAVSTGPGAWRCGLLCGYGTADCDGNLGNGCETGVISNPDACSNCGVVCSGNNNFADTDTFDNVILVP